MKDRRISNFTIRNEHGSRWTSLWMMNKGYPWYEKDDSEKEQYGLMKAYEMSFMYAYV